MTECICDCGCTDTSMAQDWMCSNCSEQKHLGYRNEK